jgi:hypothetical protein
MRCNLAFLFGSWVKVISFLITLIFSPLLSFWYGHPNIKHLATSKHITMVRCLSTSAGCVHANPISYMPPSSTPIPPSDWDHPLASHSITPKEWIVVTTASWASLCILHGLRVLCKVRISPCSMHEYIWQGLEFWRFWRSGDWAAWFCSFFVSWLL